MDINLFDRPNDPYIACPNCACIPLLVLWEEGTLDFFCGRCNCQLEPEAKALIALLPTQQSIDNVEE
jgi:hypothetical protein